MPEYTVKRIDDMEAIYWGSFRRARAELAIESFGVGVIDLPPGVDGYPEHDHAHDGQEELYVVLRGSGEIDVEGERHPIDPETMVSVKAGTKRKVLPGAEGLRILILGGVPGAVYEPPEISRLGAPDPAADQPPPA
jgi:mannose-6-phosphate isomerase-like protein (cupin superfamily)